MNKKFPHITYDLSQNKLSYRNMELVRLEHYSLVLSSIYFLKQTNLFELLGGLNLKGEFLFDLNFCNSVDQLIRDIHDKITDYFDSGLNLHMSYVRSTIRSMIVQIIWFIKSFEMYLMNDKLLFINNLVLTNHGTVNTKKTVIRVLEKENLKPIQKFILAAQFFLGKETVNIYYEQLSDNEKESFYHVNIENDFALYYWIWQLRNCQEFSENFFIFLEKFTILPKNWEDFKGDDLVYGIFFQKAITYHNEMAVHYLWTNYISKMEKRETLLLEVIEKYWEILKHSNILIYLILDVRDNELKSVFDTYCSILQTITFHRKRFRKIFFKVFKVLKTHFNLHDYFNLLYSITSSYENKEINDTDFEFFKCVFNQIPDPYKSELEKFDKSKEMFFQMLRIPFQKIDINLVTFILNHCSKGMKFNFFTSQYGMQLFVISIKKKFADERKKYNFINNVLNIYFNSIEIKLIKTNFHKIMAFTLCSDLVFDGVHKLQTFLRWINIFIDKSIASEFRFNLLSKEDWKILKKMIFTLRKKNREQILNVEEVLEWFLDGVDTNSIKSMISLHGEDRWVQVNYNGYVRFEIIDCYSNVRKLIFECEWSYLNDFMAWIKCTNNDKSILGRKLLNDTYLLEKMLQIYDDFQYFYDFSIWINKMLLIEETNLEFKAFKRRVFTNLKLLQSLVKNWDFNQIRKAIEWSDPSDNEWKTFKDIFYSNLERRALGTMTEQQIHDEFIN